MTSSSLLAGVLAAAALAAGCDTVADGKQFEQQIEAELLKSRNLRVQVTCPAKIPLGKVKDNHFDCEVLEENGARTPVAVTLDDKGAWRLEAKAAPIDPTPGLGPDPSDPP